MKFWKGDENLRPVNKKPFYEILSGCLQFGLYCLWKVLYTWTFLWDENFSLNRSNGLSKNLSLYWIQKCTFDQKGFAQETDFSGTTFTFLKSEKKRWKDGIFEISFAILEEKNFISRKGQWILFDNLKVKNERNCSIFRKTVFINRSYICITFLNFMPGVGIMKSAYGYVPYSVLKRTVYETAVLLCAGLLSERLNQI